MMGAVHLLHLEPGRPTTGDRVARHYIGYTDCPYRTGSPNTSPDAARRSSPR